MLDVVNAVPDKVVRGEILGHFGATAPCDIIGRRADDPGIVEPGLPMWPGMPVNAPLRP
jgi:hypothetical protein